MMFAAPTSAASCAFSASASKEALEYDRTIAVMYDMSGMSSEDVDVIISEAWARNNESFGIINNQLTEQSRGVRTNRWAVEKIIDAGFGLATIYYGEVDPDTDDFTNGVEFSVILFRDH